MILLSDIEYIGLRLVRRFLITDTLLERLSRLIPYYEASQGETSPCTIVDAYWDICAQVSFEPADKAVLEIGIGATNATGYEMIRRCVNSFWGYEPFRKLDAQLDQTQLESIARSAGCRPESLSWRVQRIDDLTTMPGESVDLVLSHSVLEHVDRPSLLFGQLRRVLKPAGVMIHRVDYRDHFFKYPFHFLQFSDSVWDRLLNPGDLPRHRLPDHLRMLSESAFETRTINVKHDRERFAMIKDMVHERFSGLGDDMLAVTSADLISEMTYPADKGSS